MATESGRLRFRRSAAQYDLRGPRIETDDIE